MCIRDRVYDDEARLARTLAAYEHEQTAFERLGGYRHESRARQALQTLGFSESDLELPVSALSGGQKKLLGLARLLSKDTNLLLLDEPDNHLDLAAKEGLEPVSYTHLRVERRTMPTLSRSVTP